MSELRTDFKDEILQEGEEHRIYSIKRKGTDEIVESDIYLEKAYTPLQEGNEFGAKEVNEIHGRLNGLAPQNLLINGDFKVNQRGQSSYTDTTGVTYSLDMWYLSYAVLTVNDGHITVKGNATGNLQQIVNKDLTGNTVTLIVKEKDKIPHTISGVCNPSTPITKDTGTFTMSIDYKESINKYRVNLKVSSEINLEYIALYEGDVVYKHIPEDDATALVRCQKFFIRKGISTVPYYKYGSGEDLRLGGEIPSMESVPTVNITGCFSFDNASAVNTIRSVKSAYVSDTFYLDARVVFAKPMHPNCYGVILVCEISCEPK